MLKKILLATLVILLSRDAHSSLLEFDLAWVGVNNNASAVGVITIEDTVLSQSNGFNVGFSPAATYGITGFTITVSGASAGNGTFTLADFNTFTLYTVEPFFPLDLTQELVGQTTASTLPWGVFPVAQDQCDEAGDFGFFSNNTAAAPSVGSTCFEWITANGGGDVIVLSSFAPKVPVTEPATLGILALGLAGIGFSRRRTVHV